jgi:hypothetical protein
MTLDHPEDDGREEGEDHVPYQQFHARKLLLIRLFGSLAVLRSSSFFFMPFIRAQKESRRGTALRLWSLQTRLPRIGARCRRRAFGVQPAALAALPSSAAAMPVT